MEELHPVAANAGRTATHEENGLSTEDTGSSQPGNTFKFPRIGYTLLPVLLALRYVNSPPDLRTYGPSHWFLNYHDGFVRRALVGQLFAHLTYLSWRSIFLIEAAVLGCLVLLTYLIFRPMLFGSLGERRTAAFLLAAPAFLPHLAFMGGEMDNFLYIAILLAAACLIGLENVLGLLAATIFTIVGLFMHEGFLLMFYPLILVLLVDLLHRERIKLGWIVVHLAVVALAFVAILHFGGMPGTLPEWAAHAQQRTDMPIEGAVFTALHNTFVEQVRFAYRLYTPQLVVRVILTMLMSIPYGIALWRFLRTVIEARGYSMLLARMVTLLLMLPLLLIPLGHDAIRWASALCINISLYILFLYQATPEREGNGLRARLVALSGTPAISATFLYLVALGPWGLTGNRLFSSLSNLFGK